MHKHAPIMQTLIKKQHPNLKQFFPLKPIGLFPSWYGLNNSLAQSAGKLWPGVECTPG